MHYITMHVLNKNLGSKIKQNGVVDCDYAEDPDTRMSICRFHLYILGVLFLGDITHKVQPYQALKQREKFFQSLKSMNIFGKLQVIEV